MTDQQERLYCAAQAKAQIEIAHNALRDAVVNLRIACGEEENALINLASQSMARTSAAMHGPGNVFDLVRDLGQ